MVIHAEVARKLVNETVDKSLESIYSQIRIAGVLGLSSIDNMELSPKQIYRLRSLGYTVNTYGSTSDISW